MSCIEIDEVLSTTVLYEGFFNYNEFFKISKEKIHKLLSIASKYNEDYCSDSDLEKNEVYLKNVKNCFSREFRYKFNDYISINKIKYSSFNREVSYYEIYEIVDEENDIDKLILFGSYTGNNKNFIEIFLNGALVKNIKIKLVSKKNIWPNSSEIIFEKISNN
ncbi:hypothetical protein ACH36K_16645 [Clostridium sp. MB05]|uniref:hypothetical protein n=1 Tax=Clostridium sp. MB05 TaxID=3376682 RepID=UPI003981C2C3